MDGREFIKMNGFKVITFTSWIALDISTREMPRNLISSTYAYNNNSTNEQMNIIMTILLAIHSTTSTLPLSAAF